MEIAKISSRTFTVGTTHATDTPDTRINKPTEAAKTIRPDQDKNTSTEKAVIIQEESDNSLLWKVLSILLATGWIVTLFLLWKSKQKTSSKLEPQAKPVSLNQSHKQLKTACDKADPQACKDALLNWAKALFDDNKIHSLGILAQQVDEPLAEIINRLNSHLYKNESIQWQCDNMLDICIKFEDSKNSNQHNKDTNNKLEDLYH